MRVLLALTLGLTAAAIAINKLAEANDWRPQWPKDDGGDDDDDGDAGPDTGPKPDQGPNTGSGSGPSPDPAPTPPTPPKPAPSGAAAAVPASEDARAATKPNIAAAVGESDDLTRIKGVGPKLAELCESLGVRRFDQIAAWSEADVAEVDQYLKIKGRITRDRWVEQAKFLAVGDDEGLAQVLN